MLGAGCVLPWARGPWAVALWLQAAGLAVLGACGGVALVAGTSVGAAFGSGIRPSVGIDPLTGALLVIIALVAAPAAVAARDALRAERAPGALASLTGLFALVLVGVVTARDAPLFLGCWEAMTIVPAAAILVARREEATRGVVVHYLTVTHLGGVGVWLAVLLLVGDDALGAGASGMSAGTQAAVLLAAIVGFGTKAGLVPLHSWLPRTHPVAPAHISAVMSGVMVKVALYGLIRVVLDWAGAPPLWAGLAILALGAVSALGGIVVALLQREMKRLLAFSTIENVGIVALGVGAAAILTDRGQPAWAGVALAAALLHAANHAALKGLLFLGAGVVQRGAGGTDLDRLGGLLRRMPRAGLALGIGLVAIAGIPPLNAFASEWLTLQSLTALGRQDATAVALAGGIALAVLAATAAAAALCFARTGGLALLGAPRTPAAQEACEPPAGTVGAMGVLAAACIALGALPGLVVPSLAALAPGAPALPDGVRLSVPGTSVGTLGVAAILVALTAGILALRGRRAAAPAPAWACGQPADAGQRWTSAAFAGSLTVSAAPLVPEHPAAAVPAPATRPAAAVPAPRGALVRRALAAAGVARRIQGGDLRAYVAYLIGLVILLLALARLGALG